MTGLPTPDGGRPTMGRPFPLEPVRPRYGAQSLADVMPSALAVLGVPGAADPLGLVGPLEGVRRMAVLLVDGLGWHQIPLAASSAPTLVDLAASHGRPLTAGFPSTTPTSVVTLGTGAAPGGHGVLGFRVNVPGTDRVLTHIRWAGPGPRGLAAPTAADLDAGPASASLAAPDPEPRLWQPLPTQFELARAAGVTVVVVSRPEYAGSGLTTAAYSGGEYRPASGSEALATEMLAALTAGPGPVLVSGYHPDLDQQGHLAGVDSPSWHLAATEVDRLVAHLVDGLPDDGALLVTADHGQLNVPAEHRFDLDADPRLRAGVRVVAGEPRVRYLHVEPGARDDVVAAWRAVLGPAAWVATRDEAVAAGWFGPVPESHLARVGDVVVACHDTYAVLATRTDAPIEAQLIAFHGSYTAAEMTIPLLVVRG